MPDDPAALTGLVLVLTRPMQQARATRDALTAAGATVVSFPVLAIEPLSHTNRDALSAPAAAIVFVSANAVEFSWDALAAAGLARDAALFAIGEATARALRARGATHVITPDDGQDSEALLAMPQLMSVKGRRVLLVRGVSEGGGRRTLAGTLRARGADVVEFECYRRRKITADEQERRALLDRMENGAVHGFFALSVETAQSLTENLQTFSGWQRSCLLVPHPRVAAATAGLEFAEVLVAPMEDAALIDWLRAEKLHLLRFGGEPAHD
ncbi:MAG: uroporphyrinogen-III synthase [Betaproteobacteria bacterium]|nr:uroporphyrinogen-III synthase [Betaproteobacteria bacterium]